MKRSALIVALVVCHAWALADWKEVARNQDFALYQDADADRVDGANVQTRELQHYLTETSMFGMKIGSKVLLRAYDCRNKTRRATRSDLFERGMAEGKAFDWSDMPDAPWQPVAGEPLGLEGLDAACRRAAARK